MRIGPLPSGGTSDGGGVSAGIEIGNTRLQLRLQGDTGRLAKLTLADDPHAMNWVVDPDYLKEAGYPDEDKLFGGFVVVADGREYRSEDARPVVQALSPESGGGERERPASCAEVRHVFPGFEVRMTYRADGADGGLDWRIELRHAGGSPVRIERFSVWASLAYVMFKDTDVRRNMNHSCAVFPSISKHFSKLACVRRSNAGPHLGLYATQGATRSVGTWCRFENLFFHNVSPSLDGILYHQLVLAGQGAEPTPASEADWIYGRDAEPLLLADGASEVWAYRLLPFADRAEFETNGLALGHPAIDYMPVVVEGGQFEAFVELPTGRAVVNATVESREQGKAVVRDVTELLAAEEDTAAFAGKAGDRDSEEDTAGSERGMSNANGKPASAACLSTAARLATAAAGAGGEGERLVLRLTGLRPGEHKLSLVLNDGRTDSTVFNVVPPLRQVLEARADYIARYLTAGPDGTAADAAEAAADARIGAEKDARRGGSFDAGQSAGLDAATAVKPNVRPDMPPYALLPVSNQGESLGKAVFVLMNNALGDSRPWQVRRIEASAVHYIRPKWFADGDFLRPVKLYGDFYRIFDLDYVAHVFYLLSRFRSGELALHEPEEYLAWAADVMILRLDERLHEEERERRETRMLGVYILFIEALLADLARCEALAARHARLNALWRAACERLREESGGYEGAVTEHYYDNAGFGPTCEALCRAGALPEAARYGELLLANVGFSNDFRAQNPDRWWEALSYMIHSLWGGLTAASTLVAYEALRESGYLTAAYRATAAVFYCYDWHAEATAFRLQPGQAASTYSVVGPHLNRPDLSRDRFGQSVFGEADGEIFAGLFDDNSGYDWDMGEELAAYLAGFGTKTYLYRDAKGRLRCANGEIRRTGGRYEVTSYAAYPREYFCFEDGFSYRCEPGEEARTILYGKGGFSLV